MTKRKIQRLTAQSIKGIKATNKRQQFYDGDYLYLFVSATGKKTFYLKGYRFNGKPINAFAIGSFNDGKNGGALTLAQARDKAREIISTYKDGIDYYQQAKEQKRLAAITQANTFKHWYDRFIESKSANAPSTLQATNNRANRWIIPKYGSRPIDSFGRRELIEFLNDIGRQGKHTTRNKVAQIMAGVFELALNHEVITANPATNIIRALPKKPPEQHHPALTTPHEVAQLARDIYAYSGTAVICALVKLSLHVMLRPIEARSMRWEYVDFDTDLIRFPLGDIKTREYHIVPLTRQVKDILLEVKALTGDSEFVFHMGNNQKGYPSENAVNTALKRMGYQGKQTAHGFRTTASTMLNESGKYSKDAIEKQLAHNDQSQIRAVYNRADYLQQRREILQDWSDLIDDLRKKHAPGI